MVKYIWWWNMDIKSKRLNLNMTQEELAVLLGVSSRTIRRYENGEINKYKKDYIFKILDDMAKIDEEHGILKYEDVVKIVNKVANNYRIEFIYLFGSYSKNQATEKSDVDLLIKTQETGLSYFGIVEDLRIALKKKVDLVNVDELVSNQELLVEILKDGVKIYG